ncbi:olfactory receptor 51G2-like [Hemicordylus capensis]|uniref:olfactory receptor 51G2-like n=1 Tax=Hemicordylus capensis TaxID=884348 RepID=UPI0023032DAA|nr:olfactory receptor 51G2-like [Hemicordylus capensis]XP_053163182.1 olfactory receptor 51G2-like [Hemicordylus capensis]XP_053163183.1 olfactory receptor 51G2-like [Hemicordylus capensis]
MSSSNGSAIPPVFLLTGFPGLEHSHIWISIPICSMYLTAIAGNCTILFIIKTDPTLHEPMYYFLSMLALSDLGLSSTTLPTMLSVLWFNRRVIDFNACLVQMYFIHTFSIIESGILLSMAFDRLVAIRNPLRYTTILTNDTIIKIGVGVTLRAALLVLPTCILLKRLQYGGINVLSYSFCLHQDILKVVRSDNRLSSIYGLMVVISSMALDSVLLVFSYIMILKTVLSIASRVERLRALNTCISHICAVLTFYIPMIGLSMIHRYGKNAPPVVHILMANVYLLVPPLMNPIVYSVKTKQIRTRIVRRFLRSKDSSGAS